ncbi:MAG: aldehyde ferredoxin oxidoreductase family protein [Thaumarchaeota archaeon]|nr:aldehyde ferredoxin oxidoreductase family protein [Nitrososphaerota archaeon]MCL5317336.1 aldehyde ferredoxin oxidoreductase family protein [Nitrososphaerota archaeon]
MISEDPLRTVLYIDLSKRSFWTEDRRDLFEQYIGGTGVAINLLQKECRQNANPLGPDNPIIFAVGPLTGVFPLASKTVALFKSPLTGNLGESHAGGRSATAIRMAGYGAIVIKGASETPVYLVIDSDKVHFKDASALWGLKSSFTVGRIIREQEDGAGLRTIMRIGGAGEKMVSYACVITETYRHFGRLGLGAVFGSKKLKAISVSGRRRIKVENPKTYRELYKEVFNRTVKSPAMKKYHDLGTAVNISPLNELKALPTENLKQNSFDQAGGISGESIAEKYLGRRVACSHCPVSCIHLATYREPYASEPYFYKTTMVGYDYELIYSFGTMLKISSPEGLLKILDEVEKYGLDVMSTGVALAWATEAQERNLIPSEGDVNGAKLRLQWGDYDTYIKAIEYLTDQPNDFYKALARGVSYASSKYGGSEFALSFGGNEMPGYHTGPAAHIGHLIGSRHSHLDGAGYSIDQQNLKEPGKSTPENIAKALIDEEKWRQILSSLTICFFARGIYDIDTVLKTLSVLGYKLTKDDLTRIGSEILREKYQFKIREGFNPRNITIPKRILETPSPHGVISEDTIRKGVESATDLLEKL